MGQIVAGQSGKLNLIQSAFVIIQFQPVSH